MKLGLTVIHNRKFCLESTIYIETRAHSKNWKNTRACVQTFCSYALVGESLTIAEKNLFCDYRMTHK